MLTINTTSEFDGWLLGLKNCQGRAAIAARIQRAEEGNFGGTEPVGHGVSEMRVFVGPGYRIYYVRSAITSYLMLYGSDKADQRRGIRRAKEILDALRGKRP